MKAVLIQSAAPGAPPWLARCRASVAGWAAAAGFAYRFEDDVFLARVPADIRARYAERRSTLADVARLVWAREALAAGAERVLWLDADVLLFDPDRLRLPADDHAFGWEAWVAADPGRPNRLRVRRQVHNALSLFETGNPVLDFYLHSACRILRHPAHQGPAQAVGPKLLTALHAFARFPLVESLGALSPPVLRDLAALAAGGPCGPALRRFRQVSPPLAGANLCGSLMAAEPQVVEAAVGLLLETRGRVLRGD